MRALLQRSWLAVLLAALAVPLVAAAPTVAVFVAALAVYAVGLGMIDATTNLSLIHI